MTVYQGYEALLRAAAAGEIDVFPLRADVREDYPFHDDNWTVMRHWGNKKGFAFVFQRQDQVWVNVKCDPAWTGFWRNTYPAVRPAYHMNKAHWNTIVLDGTVPVKDIETMIGESYRLTLPQKCKQVTTPPDSVQAF